MDSISWCGAQLSTETNLTLPTNYGDVLKGILHTPLNKVVNYLVSKVKHFHGP